MWRQRMANAVAAGSNQCSAVRWRGYARESRSRDGLLSVGPSSPVQGVLLIKWLFTPSHHSHLGPGATPVPTFMKIASQDGKSSE